MPLKLGSNVDLSKVVKTLGQKMKLVPHLEMAIGEGDFDWQFTYAPKVIDDAWHPSGDCTPTLRELYLKAQGRLEQRPFTASSYKTFMVGHFWHQYLQWLVHRKLGFAGEEDIERRGVRAWAWITPHQTLHEPHPLNPPKPYHWATGAGDIAPCRIPGHGDYLVDFKTQRSSDFKRVGLPAWAADKYEAQINIYMDFFDMEKALIVCVEKDSPHDMKELEYRRNQPLIDAVYRKWRLVSECLDEGIEPPEGEDIELPLTGPCST